MHDPIPSAQPAPAVDTLRAALEAAQIGLHWYRGMLPNYVDGSDDEMDAQIDAALALANDGTQAKAEPMTIPDGFALVPHYRGYARLGTGQYILNNSAPHDPAELIISVATEQEKVGRVVGDSRDNPPGKVLQPEAMAVRLRFATVAGLDALEQQLRFLREEHFPSTPSAPVGDGGPSQPAYWKGERVTYTNDYHVSFGAVIKRVETRWSTDRKPFHYAHILCDGESRPMIVPQRCLSATQAKGGA